MILVADSGSTKTDWGLVGQDGSPIFFHTQGCNPYFCTPRDLRDTFSNVKEQLAISLSDTVSNIYFYGAGCTPGDKTETITQDLGEVFGHECQVCVGSDMLGAAIALCDDREGIACILGTGSNSCLYDGNEITTNTPPLGYILGDEGSGANLGKLLVGNILKDQLPSRLKDEFLNTYGSTAEIINRVYRQPAPNRWLASLSPFIHSHLDCAELRQMTKDAFAAFFRRNVTNYRRSELPIGLVGSVAYHYRDIIAEAAAELHLTIGKILKQPIEELTKIHHDRHYNH